MTARSRRPGLATTTQMKVVRANTVPATGEPAENEETLATAESAGISLEQFNELKEQAAKATENWDRFLRTTADFDNFKKRAAREKQEAIKFANEAFRDTDGQLLATGETTHVICGRNGKPKLLPHKYRAILRTNEVVPTVRSEA